MPSHPPPVLTPHETITVFLPTSLVYTAVWACLFLLYQRAILPLVFRSFSTTSVWYTSLPISKQRHYLGRLLFSIHHFLVAYHAIIALTTATTNPTTALHNMRRAMYHEVACDIFDVAVIALTEKGFTGLHWQGLLLHHILSILAILTTFTLHTPLATTAHLALLLDGTGATDYLFNTLLLPHTPLAHSTPTLLAGTLTTTLFFTLRLLWFPWLAVHFAYSGWVDGGWWTGLVCGVLMALTYFFNVGMMKTRWRQYRVMWQRVSHGSGSKAYKQQQYDEREMDDRSSIVL